MKKSRMFLFLLALLATACHPVPAAAHDMRKTQQKFQDMVNRIDEELAREAAGLPPPINPNKPTPTPIPLPPTPTPTPTPTPHPLEIPVKTEDEEVVPLNKYTTIEEQEIIKEKTLAFIDEFVDQSATETSEDREARIASFLTPDSVIDKILLYPDNTYSSMYALVKETTGSDPFGFYWSHAQDRYVVTLVNIAVTFTDADDFTDSNTRFFKVDFHKEKNGEWLIYNLKDYTPSF